MVRTSCRDDTIQPSCKCTLCLCMYVLIYIYRTFLCEFPKLVLLMGSDIARCHVLEAWMTECIPSMHEYAPA